MAKKEKEEKQVRGGCFGKFVGFVFFLLLIGFGAAVFFILQPQDLKGLGGYSEAGNGVAPRGRDIGEVLKKSIEVGYSVTLSEGDLNRWLAGQIEVQQGGQLGRWVSLKNVWVRLYDGYGEVIIEREVMGRALTTSMFIKIEQRKSASGTTTEIHLHGGDFHELIPKFKRGGRFGKLVVPQGFLVFVLADFRKLGVVFDEEIELAFQRMSGVEMEAGRLILDPQVAEVRESF